MAIGNGTDIHEVLPPYGDPQGLPKDLPILGQIVMTVAPEFGHPLKMLDIQRSNQISHLGIEGEIRPIDPGKDYRPKNRLPIHNLRLSDGEELLAIRSKVRRCLVIATSTGIADHSLPEPDRNIARNAFQRPSYLVAPIYSVATPTDPRAMTVTIAARAECLVYPHLVFLPRTGGIIRCDSVARLDRSFWTSLAPPTEVCEIRLSDDRMAILEGQIQVLRGQEPAPEYLEMVELLRGELAPEHERHLA